jgi:hypothetical protein
MAETPGTRVEVVCTCGAHCNELNPNVFRFRAGSGRQLARSVLGEGGA